MTRELECADHMLSLNWPDYLSFLFVARKSVVSNQLIGSGPQWDIESKDSLGYNNKSNSLLIMQILTELSNVKVTKLKVTANELIINPLTIIHQEQHQWNLLCCLKYLYRDNRLTIILYYCVEYACELLLPISHIAILPVT